MKKRLHIPGAAARDADDAFRAAFSDVTPLRHSGTLIERPRPLPLPAQRRLDERAVLRESLRDESAWDIGLDTGEELSFVRRGIDARTLSRLRRGHWVIQDELDLHGLNSSEAHALLAQFLAQCARRGLRCIRIVHGKGLRSKAQGPVLKQLTDTQLRRRADVLAFSSARPAQGGRPARPSSGRRPCRHGRRGSPAPSCRPARRARAPARRWRGPVRGRG